MKVKFKCEICQGDDQPCFLIVENMEVTGHPTKCPFNQGPPYWRRLLIKKVNRPDACKCK